MGVQPTELLTVLSETIALLKKHGETHWAQWLEKDKALIEHSDAAGLDHLLSAFGGMGSLNDVFICQSNDHDITEQETSFVNNRLYALRSRLYELAEEAQKEITEN